jgi:hypothetical protein
MITIKIKDHLGYHTNQVQGHKASSTCSPEAAAERLAVKVFGDGATVANLRWVAHGQYEAEIMAPEAA